MEASTPPQQVRTAEDIAALAKEHLKHNYAKAPNQSQDEANYIQDVAEINWARGFKAAMKLYRTRPGGKRGNKIASEEINISIISEKVVYCI